MKLSEQDPQDVYMTPETPGGLDPSKPPKLSYAAGGTVGSLRLSQIDPNDIDSQSVASNGNVPRGTPSSSPLKLSQLNPDDVTVEAENKQQAQYGTAGQQALAGVEGVARGGSLGTSDFLETQLAHFNPQLFGPQAIKGREEANPITSFAGNVLGTAGLIGATGGIAGPLEAGLAPGVGGLAARVLGFGAEGGVLGGGNAISDAALGDPSLNAQKVLGHIGMGAALGGGLGALSKGIGLGRALMRGNPEVDAAELATASSAEGIPVSEAPSPELGKTQKSLAEMKAATDQMTQYGGLNTELPEKAVAQDAHSRVGPLMQLPINEMQFDSLNSKADQRAFKAMRELPGEAGKTIQTFEGAQKGELTNILDNTVNDIAPGYQPTSDAAVGGERASDALTTQIQGVRDSLGPAFEQIKSTPLNNTNHLAGVMEYLTDSNSSPYANGKIANMFDFGGDDLNILPYKTGMGIDKSTYSAIKQAVESLQENPEDFEKLFDIRKGMSQNVDVTKLGDAAKEVGKAKAAMMDYIQDAVQSQDPDLQVRDTFANYAKNEQNAQLVEKKFGAEIGSDNFRSMAKGKAEESILGKIFSDSATTNAVKNILPPQEFSKLLADHLAILRNNATDNGVFSSNKFFSKIRGNQYALNEAFAGNPEPLQKIKDATTLLRIFPDSTPINPSGTTQTFFQGMINAGINPIKQLENVFNTGKKVIDDAMMARQINAKLAGQADAANKLSTVQGILQKVNDTISSGAKSIFNSNAVRGGVLGGANNLSDDEFDKIKKRLGDFTTNPQSMMDHVADNTQHMYQAAPQITQALHTSIYQGVQFLNSKMPQPPSQMPLSGPWEPSAAQRSQFNQYYQAVNEPLSTFKQVKQSSLSNNHMEALQTVHPQLLQEMRSKVIGEMTTESAQKLPYDQKLTLAKFLGEPLDENMTTLAIVANQLALSSPSQSQQTSGAQAGKGKALKIADRTSTRTNQKDES
jgi:hypothetical protein